MARTKKTVKVAEALELDKTLKVADQTYNINAKKAEKVENALVINERLAENSVDIKTFDGSSSVSIEVVSAEKGGHFKKPISVPSNDLKTADGKTVINYGDVSSLITTLTGSGWYNWGNNTFTTVTKSDVSQHLGIVVGKESDLLDMSIGFAMQNYYKKYLPMYLYIGADTGTLYYGTDSLTTATRMSTQATSLVFSTTGKAPLTADDLDEKLNNISTRINNITSDSDGYEVRYAKTAESAKKLSSTNKLKVDLASSDYANFNGSGGQTLMGVTGVLPETAGGTGKTSLADVKVGMAANADTATMLANTNYLKVDLESSAMGHFDGTATNALNVLRIGVGGTLPVTRGGTGAEDLAAVTVGKADQVKITVGTTPVYANIKIAASSSFTNGVPTGGSDGDIMILY